jgi:hypothetical protein
MLWGRWSSGHEQKRIAKVEEPDPMIGRGGKNPWIPPIWTHLVIVAYASLGTEIESMLVSAWLEAPSDALSRSGNGIGS